MYGPLNPASFAFSVSMGCQSVSSVSKRVKGGISNQMYPVTHSDILGGTTRWKGYDVLFQRTSNQIAIGNIMSMNVDN